VSVDPSRRERVYVTGFMGSGKSTVGPILANAIGYEFVDLDRSIEIAEDLTIGEIFQSRGESFFRAREEEFLARYSRQSRLVVALGGGTLVDPVSFRIVASTGILLYLRVPPDLLMTRLRHRTDRPLLMDVDGQGLPEQRLRERIKQLYLSREPLYRQADVIVDADERRVGLTVDRAVRALSRMLE
jgi:shikimate kinase